MTGSAMVSQMVSLFDDLGREIANGGSPEDTLCLLTKRAVEHVPGAQDAGITRARSEHGEFESVGTTSETVQRVDEVQYDLRSGPCVDAALDSAVYLTGNLREDPRWPLFGKRAAGEDGVESMLSFRMFFEDDDYIAALNLYSPERDAFDEQSCLTGLTLSTYGALAVTSARRRERVVNLERAAVRQTERLQIELQPAGLGVMRIDIRNDQDRVAAFLGFAVGDQCVVVRVMKLQAAVAL